MSQFRGFISLDVGAFPKLLQLENEIRKSGAIVKLVEPENVHITLKFLGDTDEALIDSIEEIMKESVKESEPFDIKLNGAGVFPDRKYIRILWIGIKNGENIGKIAKKINEQISGLGFEKEKREFSAHLTFGRVKSAKNKEKLLQIIDKYRDIEFASIKVDSIKLKKSELTPEGPIYTTIKDVKF